MFVLVPAWVALRSWLWKREHSVNRALLSRPARDTIREYHSLPVDSRVMGEWELRQALHALDVTHGGRSAVNKHFRTYSYDGSNYSFKQHHARCYSIHSCNLRGYLDIVGGIRDIKKSLAEREQAMKTSAVAGSLENVEHIAKRLREENSLITQITKELA